MNKTEKCIAARDYHNKGCNCTQSILATFHEEMGLAESQCLALGGGMGNGVRCGSICGAVSGGVMVLGMLFPATAEEGVAGKKRVAQQTREYIRRFQDRFTDLNCAELLLNKEIQGTQQAELLGVTNHCGILIISAVEILCDYIAELKEE